ncbi:hypothetical protein MLPM_1932 [Mycobacterium lepromatosis]|uniref:Transmembrane protein n=1 Tax=Mycobacterium lepromatosis TaxID=480418 RepID=A0A0F4EPN6_9MYCO|nr:hypothetical protein MLPM_1932 [Mycobacterium lepromatosis]
MGRGLSKTVNRAVIATTAAAGAVGGAAVNSIVGGVKGAAEGVKREIRTGSHSAPAGALVLGALGVAGLVEWPTLLAVGSGALLLRKLSQKPNPTASPAKDKLKPVPTEPMPHKTTSKPGAKKTTGRRAATTALQSTN